MLFGLQMRPLFMLGTSVVVFAVWLYSGSSGGSFAGSWPCARADQPAQPMVSPQTDVEMQQLLPTPASTSTPN
jgi:hypothetical protein